MVSFGIHDGDLAVPEAAVDGRLEGNAKVANVDVDGVQIIDLQPDPGPETRAAEASPAQGRRATPQRRPGSVRRWRPRRRRRSTGRARRTREPADTRSKCSRVSAEDGGNGALNGDGTTMHAGVG